jgi:hypothetical protein
VDTPVAPGSSAPVGDTGSGAPGTVSESAAADGSPQGLSIAGAGDTGTSGGATPDGTQGSGESAIAPFGQTELADGGLLAPSDSIDSAPPFSSRLWAALPLGLLIGLVLVGVALGAVRIARLGTTP